MRPEGARTIVVAAVARNGIIGGGNRLVWRIPGDLKRFREITMGRSIVMGRSTFASIGRPLAGRRTIVLSRDPEFSPPGVEVARSWDEAHGRCSGDLYVVGGATLYAAALPVADLVHLTEVECDPEGDVSMPDFDRRLFAETLRERHDPAPGDTCGYSFVDLARIRSASSQFQGSGP